MAATVFNRPFLRGSRSLYPDNPARPLSAALVGSAALLTVNTAYLAASASPTLFFYANVGLHVVLAPLVVVLAVAYRFRVRPQWSAAARAGWWAVVGCAGVGVWLAAVGATRAHQTALVAH